MRGFSTLEFSLKILLVKILNLNKNFKFFLVNALAIQIDGDSSSRSCLVGLIAFLPDELLPPLQCKDLHESYACGYSEGRCDGRLFCGTPPCTWRLVDFK